ncbi:MAG: exosome complex RNA-binding protein Rrp4 [Ignisphaera sp.]
MSKNSVSQTLSKRSIVVPGDTISLEGEIEHSYYLYKEDNKLVTTVISLLDIEESENKKKIRLIPLKGRYLPKEGDIVIGIVRDVTLSSWIIDINAPYYAILNATDYLGRSFSPVTDNIRKYLDVGDVILAKIAQFDRSRNPILTTQDKDLGKIIEGSLVEIEPSKVARVIGKKKSMLMMLEEQTKCSIIVGNNGRILLKCPDPEYEYIAILAIKKIEQEAHIPGLTERIRSFIIEEKIRRGLIKRETG